MLEVIQMWIWICFLNDSSFLLTANEKKLPEPVEISQLQRVRVIKILAVFLQ